MNLNQLALHIYRGLESYLREQGVIGNGTPPPTLPPEPTPEPTLPPPGNIPPVAWFTHSLAGPVCSFRDASTDPDGNVASWMWDFGDGETSVEKNPIHTYAGAGEYNVTLTVRDNSDGHHSVSHVVSIVDAPPPPPPPTSPPPASGEFFVSPDGTASGDGTWQRPWSLQHALTLPIQPGSILHMRGGTHRGVVRSKLKGTADARIIVRPYLKEKVLVDLYPAVPGGENWSIFQIGGEYTDYRGLEIFSSDPRTRRSSERGSGPMDQRRGSVEIRGSHNRLIGCIIHDLNKGVGLWSNGLPIEGQPLPVAVGGEIISCVIYNNGWMAPDRQHGPGIYTQNKEGTKRIFNTVVFGQLSNGIEVYGSGTAELNNVHIDGCSVFCNGAQHTNGCWDIHYSGGRPIVGGRVTRCATHQWNFPARVLLFGDEARNTDMTIEDNYFASHVRVWSNWDKFTFRRNIVRSDNQLLADVRVMPDSAEWDHNSYHSTHPAPFRSRNANTIFETWKKRTSGFDQNSTYILQDPAAWHRIIQAEPWSTIQVFNWAQSATVPIDLSTAVRAGQSYTIHHVYDLANPVVSGVYDGAVLRLPMKRYDLPKPIAFANPTDEHVTAEFGCFILRVED